MTVGGLIKILERFDPQHEVLVPCSEVRPDGTVDTTDLVMLKPMKHWLPQNPRHVLIAPREGPYAEKDFQLIQPPFKGKDETDGQKA